MLSCQIVVGSESMQLNQIDWQQGHVKKEDRVDMSQQAIENEQDVAHDGEYPKREYRRHTKACQDCRSCAKAKAIYPEHRLFAPRGQPRVSRPLFRSRTCGRGTAGEYKPAENDHDSAKQDQRAAPPSVVGHLFFRRERP
jgi:hypothetical protein